MNSSSEHVIGSYVYNRGEVKVGEISCNVILIGPVGRGNITVGFFKTSETTPMSDGGPPVGLFPDYVVLPVYVKVVDPSNKVLFENDMITPGSFTVDFVRRGEYKIYLTNNGEKISSIPVGTEFDLSKDVNNIQNIEADKYLLSITLTLLGAGLVSIGVIIQLSKHQLMHKPKKTVLPTT
jgi:hypothetical protein